MTQPSIAPQRISKWKDRLANAIALGAVAFATALIAFKNLGLQDDSVHFLNVSYDPTRELYRDVNAAFIAKYQGLTKTKIAIRQSHGGSSRQARAVIDGVPADVVTLAIHSDIDALCKQGLVAQGWAERLPNSSRPYTSTIVFVVRAGNPRAVHDFADLLAPGVQIVTPNPKTSGNGKLSFLAAWGSVIHRGGTEDDARSFVKNLYEHVAALEAGARDATTDFTQEKLGDVQITWENEALLEVDESHGDLEVVYPPASILAEPYVAWVDANVKRKGTEALAKAYLEFLFTESAQEIVARHGYRPILPDVLQKYRARLPDLILFPVTIMAKDWEEAQIKFFADNGIFDTIYRPRHP
ncbi:MAG: sulfate ABC transporter substrate-binding protein [Polyangiaceae bacterium]